jgi:hypothetical protein
MTTETEIELRGLRDTVYGPGSEAEWEKCKANWSRPDAAKFLRAEAAKVRARALREHLSL